MKNIISIVLEKHEVEKLKGGEMLQFTVGGQSVELYFETKIDSRGGSRRGSLKVGEVLEVIQANPGMASREIAEKIGLKPDAIYHHINKLKAGKKIQRDVNGKLFPIDITRNGNGNGHKLVAAGKNGH